MLCGKGKLVKFMDATLNWSLIVLYSILSSAIHVPINHTYEVRNEEFDETLPRCVCYCHKIGIFPVRLQEERKLVLFA